MAVGLSAVSTLPNEFSFHDGHFDLEFTETDMVIDGTRLSHLFNLNRHGI